MKNEDCGGRGRKPFKMSTTGVHHAIQCGTDTFEEQARRSIKVRKELLLNGRIIYKKRN